jgi:outer membrane protein OmpA-like peptidoglycan-associated protein
MTVRQPIIGLVLIAGLCTAGCAIRDPQALTDLNQARTAIDEARRAGNLPPGQLSALEQRHLQARGVFYACRDAEASRLAQAIIADARARPVVAAPPPPANQPPRARISAPAEGEVNAALTFSGEGSSDPDGDRLTYRWDFGDGTSTSLTTPTATHPYARAGNYTVRLMVDDGRGGTDATSATVAVIRRVMLQETVGRAHFDFDKATLKPAAEQELAPVVQELQENRTLQAELVGHTDSIGSDAYNLGLSKRRAEAVRNYMVAKGITQNRLKVDWKGEREPIAPNTTKAGQAQNRRVEITLRPLPVQ